jgi:hypothetical protein
MPDEMFAISQFAPGGKDGGRCAWHGSNLQYFPDRRKLKSAFTKQIRGMDKRWAFAAQPVRGAST